MQALSKAAAGKSYTIKWMFGIPEVLDKIRKCKIDEGSEITVIQNSGRDLIIRSGEKRIAMSSDAACPRADRDPLILSSLLNVSSTGTPFFSNPLIF